MTNEDSSARHTAAYAYFHPQPSLLIDSTMNQALLDAIEAMNSGKNVFDVTIICTTDDHQAAYWMDRLRSGLLAPAEGSSLFPMVLAVSEDWNSSGGAGNGLGTLYAFQKASALAKKDFGVDLMDALLKAEVSAALYHTAGKGTRMAPLPASENNNKPGVKLPFPLLTSTASSPESKPFRLTSVLEAVVKQTGIYASSRKGRLSVFWGDQVFLPSASFVAAPTHHIDILCTLTGADFPTSQEWQEKGLDKYGCIACVDKDGGRLEAAQVEKVSHETAVKMLSGLGTLKQVGPSLGSFSVSAAFLQALASEFNKELNEKTEKFDTDPHFWMPLTLTLESYVSIMGQKGVDAAEATNHFHRVGKMKEGFDLGSLGLFGAVDVGSDACWWDYGQLKLYSQNSLLLLEESPSADLLRKFLNVSNKHLHANVGSTQVDGASYLFGVNAKSGSVTKSIVANVAADVLEIDGAIVVNCAAKKIKAGPGAILYNMIADGSGEIVVGDGEIHVAVTDETGKSMTLRSHMDIDGGNAWKQKLDMNELSFEDAHKRNKDAAITEIAKKRDEHFAKVAAAL